MSDTLSAAEISPNQLPVIDVSGLSSSKAEDRKAVGAKIRAACIDNGFFYISNHGIPQGLIEAIEQQARGFFSQPDEAKAQVAKTQSKCNRGWEPLKAQSLDVTAPPDLKETFYLGLDLPLDHPMVVAGKFNYGPNQWPVDLPGFKPAMRASVDAPVNARRIFRSGIARSRVLTSVRPLLRPSYVAGPYGSSRIESKSYQRAWFALAQHTGFPDPVSLTVAPYLPFDLPTSSTTSDRTAYAAATGAL